MAGADEDGADFAGKVVLGFGNFAGNVNVRPCIRRLLEIALCAAGTPCDGVQAAFGVAHGHGFAPQRLLDACAQGIQGARVFGQRTDVQQVLFAEHGGLRPAQALRQLRVIAQNGVCVQWQMIARQIDVVRQQCGNALFLPAGNHGRLAFPEHAVVHQQHLRVAGGGKINGCARCGDGSHDGMDFIRAFHLQAVGCIVFELGGLQGFVAPLQNLGACAHSIPFTNIGLRCIKVQAAFFHCAGFCHILVIIGDYTMRI